MKVKKFLTLYIVTLVAIGLCSICYLQADDSKIIAIRGGKLITITKGDIENGVLLIEDGKISAIGNNVAIPEGAQVIDAKNCMVLPGFIDSFTNIGAVEVEGIEETREYDEATSPVTPHMRIIDALNSESKLIEVAVRSGVTAVLCAPGEGNLLSGQSAFIQLSGDRIEEMVIKFPAAVHGSLGEAPKLRYGKKNQYPSTRMGEAALLRQTLIDAQAYLDKIISYKEKLEQYEKKEKEGKAEEEKKPAPPAVNLKMKALVPIIKGEIPIIIRANRYDDILTAIRIAEEYDLKLILNHGADAYKAAEKLAAKNIPVIVGPLSPYRQSQETLGAIYENASLLHKAGVKIAFQTGSARNVGRLLHEASLTVSHGLPYEEALKALTINAAGVFGLEDKMGSLEKGKRADIVIFDGDPLNALSTIKTVIIGGKIVYK